MKNFCTMVVLVLFISFPACSQKTPPENVMKAFSAKFPNAKSVKWSEEEENEWEAEFKTGGTEMSTSFDNEGNWMETESEINSKDIPSALLSTLTKEFPGFKTDEASVIETPEIKGYEIAIKKGKESFEVVLDNNGSVLKKSDLKEEVEKEEKDQD